MSRTRRREPSYKESSKLTREREMRFEHWMLTGIEHKAPSATWDDESWPMTAEEDEYFYQMHPHLRPEPPLHSESCLIRYMETGELCTTKD